MSKSILLSIKPQWLAKILNGEKTIEVRKKFPKDYIGWVYLYCSKNGGTLCPSYKPDNTMRYVVIKDKYDDVITNEHIVARFWCDKVDRYINGCNVAKKYPTFNDFEKILAPACIYTDELENYCEDLSFFAIHISKLEIFDRPKELIGFYTTKLDEDLTKRFDNSIQLENGTWVKRITKAPQNYCYIEGE